MVRPRRVGGEDGEALRGGAERLEKVVQAEIGAAVPPRDPEPVGEAAQDNGHCSPAEQAMPSGLCKAPRVRP